MPTWPRAPVPESLLLILIKEHKSMRITIPDHAKNLFWLKSYFWWWLVPDASGEGVANATEIRIGIIYNPR